jgi:hypothetical protein
MSDEVEESEGVMYSVDGARWKWSRLLHEQETLVKPDGWTAGFVGRSIDALPGFAAVKSQCRLMKIGMSEKARNLWVLICALEKISAMILSHQKEFEYGAYLDNLIREIRRIL